MMRWLVFLLAFPLAQNAGAVDLVDDAGNRIELPDARISVVSLAPHLTEIVFAIGAGDQLVGTVEWSNFPDAAREVPRVGDAFRIDYEKVIGMQPDVVLAWGGGTPQGVIARLRKFGFAVAVLEPTSLESVSRHVRWLGKALGHEKQAANVAADFNEGIHELRHDYSGKAPVSVFYQVASQPLFTVNGQHVISEMIRVCGGRNIFSKLSTLAPAVTLEAVLGRNPDAIVMGRHAADDGSAERWKKWSDITAVSHGNLLLVDAELLARSTPRMLEGGRQLCQALDKARERLKLQSGN